MKNSLILFIVGILVGTGLLKFSGRLYYGGLVILFFIAILSQPYTNRSGNQSMVERDAKLSKLFTIGSFGYIAGGLLTLFI